jgi:hypothetical protein
VRKEVMALILTGVYGSLAAAQSPLMFGYEMPFVPAPERGYRLARRNAAPQYVTPYLVPQAAYGEPRIMYVPADSPQWTGSGLIAQPVSRRTTPATIAAPQGSIAPGTEDNPIIIYEEPETRPSLPPTAPPRATRPGLFRSLRR